MRYLICLAALAVSACASTPARKYSAPAPSVELAATPFFPQAKYQCGPAALATVLAASGADVTPDALTPQVYLPEREGSLQTELIAATRRYGRVPYVIKPDLSTLFAEVAAGSPVLVFQNLGLSALPAWHYAVVVGYDAPAGTVVLRSGKESRKVMEIAEFDDTWRIVGSWAMVAAPPDRIPKTAEPRLWLAAVSAFEELRQAPVAAAGYGAAVQRWPREVLAWQALGNALYAQRDLAGAERALRTALSIAPATPMARNNLAQVLLEQNCPLQALGEIDRALAESTAVAQREVFGRTRDAVLRYQGQPASDCAR